MKRFFSIVLSFTFLISLNAEFFAQQVEAASLYPAEGYCQRYEHEWSFDRKKVPNRSLSDYLEGLTPSESAIQLNEIKLDQNCMQQADIRFLITKTSDASRRIALQRQLNELAVVQGEINNELKLLYERQERLTKLLDILRALAKEGKNDVSKNLIDLRATALDEFNEEWKKNNEAIDQNVEKLATEVRQGLLDYKKADESGKKAMVSRLNQSVSSQYHSLKSRLESGQKSIISLVTSDLVTRLADEKNKFTETLRQEIQDGLEFSKTIDAYEQLSDERQQHYLDLVKRVLSASLIQATQMSKIIEQVIDEDQSAFSVSRLVASVLGEAAQIVETSEDRVLPSVQQKIENYDQLKPLMIELNALMHSADFQLLKILKDSSKTKLFIESIESDDHTSQNLIDLLNGLNEEQRAQIKKSFDNLKLETELAQDYYENLELKEEEEDVVEDPFEKTLEECKRSSNFISELNLECNIIAYIAGIYGGYGDYILDQVLAQSLDTKELIDLRDRAEAAHKALMVEFDKNSSLRSSEKRLFRFKLLSSLLSSTDPLVQYSSSKEFDRLSQVFSREIANLNGIMAKILSLLKDLLNSTSKDEVDLGECDEKFSKALEDIFQGKRDIKCRNESSDDQANASDIIGLINAFRSSSGLPLFNISQSSIESESTKTSNAYLPTVKSNGFSLHYHSGRGMIIRENGQASKTTLTYFNEKKQPSVQVDPIFATFYTYDSQGRLTEKTKVDSLDAIWDPSTQIFKKPQILNSKATRVKWDYTTSSSDQIRLRQEFIGSSTRPSKVIAYRYLSDDLRSINNFSGNKRKQLDYLLSQKKAIDERLDQLDSNQLIDKKISSITVSNGKENHFYYNPNLTLAFIQHKDKDELKSILMPRADELHIKRLYDDLNFDVKITSTDNDIAFYIDSFGNVWDSKKKVSFNSNVVPYLSACPPCAALAVPTVVVEGAALAKLAWVGVGVVVGAGVGYFASDAMVENAEVIESTPYVEPDIYYPEPTNDNLNQDDLIRIGAGAIGAAYAFQSLAQVGHLVDYVNGVRELPQDDADYITLYRGDYSGKTSFLAKGAKKVGDLFEIKTSNLDPVFTTGSLDEMLDAHSITSEYSPFISLTESRTIATIFATSAGRKTGSVYTLRVPRDWVIRNHLNTAEKEWLFPIYIPFNFIIKEDLVP